MIELPPYKTYLKFGMKFKSKCRHFLMIVWKTVFGLGLLLNLSARILESTSKITLERCVEKITGQLGRGPKLQQEQI